MTKKRKSLIRLVLIMINVFASVLNVDANTLYSSQRLERLASNMTIPYMESDTIIYINYKKYPVVVERVDGMVKHIGLDIFGPELKMEANLLIYRFVEQYLLEVLTCESERERLSLMYNDNVMILGNLRAIPMLTSPNKTSINILYEQGLRYKIEWSNEVGDFSISFPPQYQLLSGNNIKVLENQFSQKVLSHNITKKQSEKQQQHTGGDTIRLSKNIWAVKNGVHIIKQMKNTIYLTKPKDSLPVCDSVEVNSDLLIPVCDFEYPIESLYNLLSMSSINNDFIVDVTLNKYGFEKESFTCPLSQLIDFCITQGCIPYIGIEEIGDKIKAAVIMVQPNYGFNHMLQIVFSPNILKDMSGNLSAVINAYIPTHNILNLYGEGAP